MLVLVVVIEFSESGGGVGGANSALCASAQDVGVGVGGCNRV